MTADWSNDVVELRHRLHAAPELAGSEHRTAEILAGWAECHGADELHRLVGGSGVIAVFHGADDGDTVVLRAELDALPIQETGSTPHRSTVGGVAHLCGHDGHMAILAAVAAGLGASRPERGRVALLFQPAEETGEGAARVVEDPAFARLGADWVFALHNLPGAPLGEVRVRSGAAACGSVGFIAVLQGSTAHAAHPEQGRSPARALSRLIDRLDRLAATVPTSGVALSTVIHARLGEIAFGTTPGQATVMATLRADSDPVLLDLRRAAEAAVAEEAARDDLEWMTSVGDSFPSTHNRPRRSRWCARRRRSAGSAVSARRSPCDGPRTSGGTATGLARPWWAWAPGSRTPHSHSPRYDFPDLLLEPGSRLLSAIIGQIQARRP